MKHINRVFSRTIARTQNYPAPDWILVILRLPQPFALCQLTLHPCTLTMCLHYHALSCCPCISHMLLDSNLPNRHILQVNTWLTKDNQGHGASHGI